MSTAEKVSTTEKVRTFLCCVRVCVPVRVYECRRARKQSQVKARVDALLRSAKK